MSELLFNVQQEEDGGYWARAAEYAIFAQGDTWDELCASALGGVDAFYGLNPSEKPQKIRLHLVREQELLVA